MQIVYRNTAELIPYANNPRKNDLEKAAAEKAAAEKAAATRWKLSEREIEIIKSLK